MAAWYFDNPQALLAKTLSIAEDGAAIVWATSLPANHLVAMLLHSSGKIVTEEQARAYLEPCEGGMQ